MANRNYKRVLTPLVGEVTIAFKFAIGATGAVGTITPATGNAVKSITRNSAGNYTIVLKDTFKAFTSVQLSILQASLTAAGIQIVSYNAGTAGGATLTIATWGPTAAGNTAAVALDLANGSEIHLAIKAMNTSLANYA